FVQDISAGTTNTLPKTLAINKITSDVYVAGARNNGPSASSAYIRKYTAAPSSLVPTGFNINTTTTGAYFSAINDMDFDEVNNRLWAIGTFESDITFPGGGTKTTNTPGTGATDAFVVCYK